MTIPTEGPDPAAIQAPELLLEAPGTLALEIRRDAGFLGSGLAEQVYLDGRPVVRLEPAQATTLYLYPGSYVLAVGPTCTCGTGTVQAPVRLEGRGRLTYRIALSQWAQVSLSQEARSQPQLPP